MSKVAHALTALAVLVLTGCHGRNDGPPEVTTPQNKDEKVIRFVMSDAGFNAEIVPVLKQEVARQGFTLDWVVVNDIIQPNKLVDEGLADANSFQHEPYFDQFVTDHNLTNIVRGFYTITSPSGLFSKKYKRLADVPDGATFGIPVDPANNGRALFMLQDKGLLKLKPGVSVTHAGLRDIIENPRKFRFKEVDQLMLQRALEDVDVGFLFSGTALLVGFNPKDDALALEEPLSLPYRGIVAVHKDLVNTPKIKALQNAYASEPLKAYYHHKYGDAVTFLATLNEPAKLP